MGLTSKIEEFLLDKLQNENNKYIEIGRNDLADKFNCAPSQITYVLSTRFTPYQGYYVESRRGGSGYIKIIKLEMSEDEFINSILNDIIDQKLTLDKIFHILQSLVKEGVITKREALLIQHSIDDNALKDLQTKDRNIIRSSVFKNILLSLLR